MRLTAFDPFKHLDYVRSVLDVAISDNTGGIIALDAENTPKGVFLFDNWAENSVFGHIAIQHPMALRSLVSEGLVYIFDTCGMGMFLTNTVASNVKSVAFQKHLGFTEICRIKDGFAIGDDYVVLQLLRENCKYVHTLKEVA